MKEKKKNISFLKLFFMLILIFILTVVGIISYNKFMAYKNYSKKTFYKDITFNEIFEEYNEQLTNSSLPKVKKVNISYKVPSDFSQLVASEQNIPVDDYYLYATWKPKGEDIPSGRNRVKLSVFFNSIDFYNNSYSYIDENYNLALIKAFHNILINNNYDSISEDELINNYYKVKNNSNLHGELEEFPVNSEMTLYIGFHNGKTLISLGLNS